MKRVLKFIGLIIAIIISVSLFLFGAWIGAIAWVFKSFIFFIFATLFCLLILSASIIYIIERDEEDEDE